MANQLDILFAALADPTRRSVIAQLVEGPATVSALHAGHAMALPTFMRHLSVLEAGGVIQSTKQGRVRTVTLQADTLRSGVDWIEQHRSMWERRLDRLERLAANMERTIS